MDVVAFSSGIFAGFATTVILHPLDLIKTRFQVDENGKPFKTRQWDVVKTILYKENGLRGLYRGLFPAVLGSSASWGLYFVFYERFKESLIARQDKKEKLHPIQYLCTSALAGGITTCITNPIWLIKTRLELQTPGKEYYNGFFDAVYKIIKHEGVKGLYRGIVPALVLVSNGGVQFMVYEELKFFFKNENNKGDLDGYQYMLLGAFSKGVASTLTYPYQLAKSRMQQHQSLYTSTFETLSKTIQREGLIALYKGLAPNLLRVMPASAITFGTYEMTTRFLR